jgi:hypothetical protein
MVLLTLAVVLAYVAGWGLGGDGLSLPAGVAGAASLLMALA